MALTTPTEREIQDGLRKGRQLRSAAMLSAFKWIGAQVVKLFKRPDVAPKKNSVSA